MREAQKGRKMHVVRRKDRSGWNVGRRQEVVIMHVIKSEHVGT